MLVRPGRIGLPRPRFIPGLIGALLTADRLYEDVPLDMAQGTLVTAFRGPVGATLADTGGRFTLLDDGGGSYRVVRGAAEIAPGNLNLTITAAGAALSVPVAIVDQVTVVGRFRNVLPAPTPQWQHDILARDLTDPEMHPHIMGANFRSRQAGRFHDASTWEFRGTDGTWAAATVSPDMFEPRGFDILKSCRDPSVEANWDRGVLCGTAVVQVQHRVVCDETVSFKDFLVSQTDDASLVFQPKVGADMRITLDTGMAHGDLTIQHDDALSTAAGRPRIDIVHVAHVAPGRTARLGVMTMAPARMRGVKVTHRLFVPNAIAAGDTWVRVPGLATARWRVGDWVQIPSTDDHVRQATDPHYHGPDRYWGPFGGVESVQTPSDGYCVDTAHTSRIAELDLAGERIRLADAVPKARVFRVMTHPKTGKTRTLRPRVRHMSRSIRVRCADPTVIQKRFAWMAMHGDVQRDFVEFMRGGRTAVDASLDQGAGRLVYDRDPNDPAAQVVTNTMNVAGRYTDHFHYTGASFSAPRAQVRGCCYWEGPIFANDPLAVNPGRALVFHGSRGAAHQNNFHAQRATAIWTEEGFEINEYVENDVDYCPGDGFPSTYSSRANLWFKHGDHTGAAYGMQSRAFLAIGNIDSNCTQAWRLDQSESRMQDPSFIDWNQVSPDFRAFRWHDPIASGQFFDGRFGRYYGYPQKGPNPYNFRDNESIGCLEGIRAFERSRTDRRDYTPWNIENHLFFGTTRPFESESYVNQYNFVGNFFDANSRIDGPCISTGSAFTQAISAVECYARNYATFYKQGTFATLDSILVDNDGGVPGDAGYIAQMIGPVPLYVGGAPNDDPRGHPLYGWLGVPLAADGTPNPTRWGEGLNLSGLRNLNSSTDLPYPYPAQTLPSGQGRNGFGGIDPRPAGQRLIPGFWLDTAASTTTCSYNDTTPLRFVGALIDAFSIRVWGMNFNPDATGGSNAGVSAGSRIVNNGTEYRKTGPQLVEENGVWMDGSTTKVRLHFDSMTDRRGTPMPFFVDVTMTDIPETVRVANLLTDPNATKRVQPVKAEVLRSDPIVRTAPVPVIVEPVLAGRTVTLPNGSKLAQKLRADNGLVYWVVRGPNAAQFQIRSVAGVRTLQWAGDVARSNVDLSVEVAAVGLFGAETSFTFRALTDAFTFSDDLTVAGDFTDRGWQGNAGRYISNGDGNARISPGVVQRDTGSPKHYIEFGGAQAATFVGLRVGYVGDGQPQGSFWWIENSSGGQGGATYRMYRNHPDGNDALGQINAPRSGRFRLETVPGTNGANGVIRFFVDGTMYGEWTATVPIVGTYAGFFNVNGINQNPNIAAPLRIGPVQ